MKTTSFYMCNLRTKSGYPCHACCHVGNVVSLLEECFLDTFSSFPSLIHLFVLSLQRIAGISLLHRTWTLWVYINRGNREFRDIVAHEYVDKSSLIPIVNATLNSENRYSCVTRSRRFGKSMAAKMLCAYYDKSCDSRELFHGLKSRRGQYIRDHYCPLKIFSIFK